jgi:hypothetical protein
MYKIILLIPKPFKSLMMSQPSMAGTSCSAVDPTLPLAATTRTLELVRDTRPPAQYTKILTELHRFICNPFRRYQTVSISLATSNLSFLFEHVPNESAHSCGYTRAISRK